MKKYEGMKKLLSLLLAFSMVLSVVPVTAGAVSYDIQVVIAENNRENGDAILYVKNDNGEVKELKNRDYLTSKGFSPKQTYTISRVGSASGKSYELFSDQMELPSGNNSNEDECRVTIYEQFNLKVTVKKADGTPVANQTVKCENSTSKSATTNEDGVANLGYVRGILANVKISADYTAADGTTKTVSDNFRMDSRDQNRTLTIPDTKLVTIWVTDPEGYGITDAAVTVGGQGFTHRGNGEYVGAVEAGNYSVSISATGYNQKTDTITVGSGSYEGTFELARQALEFCIWPTSNMVPEDVTMTVGDTQEWWYSPSIVPDGATAFKEYKDDYLSVQYSDSFVPIYTITAKKPTETPTELKLGYRTSSGTIVSNTYQITINKKSSPYPEAPTISDTLDVSQVTFTLPSDLKGANSLKIQATGSNVSKEMTVSNPTAGQTVAMDFGETLRGKITFAYTYSSDTMAYTGTAPSETAAFYQKVDKAVIQDSYEYTGVRICPEVTDDKVQSVQYGSLVDGAPVADAGDQTKLTSDNDNNPYVAIVQLKDYYTDGTKENGEYRTSYYLPYSIVPRNLTVKLEDQKILAGETLDTDKKSITSGSLLDGHSLHVTFSNDTQVPVNNGPLAAEVKVQDAAGQDASKYYNITQNEAALTVKIPENAITITAANVVYNSAEQKPVVVKWGEKTLTEGTDYTITYAKNRNAGTAEYTVTGLSWEGEPSSGTFQITKAPLTVTGYEGCSKVYDGTVALTGVKAALEGICGQDAVSLDATYSFDTADAGENKTISLSNVQLTGEAADNYELTETPTQTTGSITKRPVTVTPENASKTYGEADPELKFTVDDMVAGETLSGVALTRASGEAAGTYTITAAVEENANPNYSITLNTGNFTVHKKELTVSVTVSKQFDNTTPVDKEKDTFDCSLQGIVNDEAVTLGSSEVAAEFAAAETGENISVTLTGAFKLAGEEAVLANYTLTQPENIVGTIYNTYDASGDYTVEPAGWTNGVVTITAANDCTLCVLVDGPWGQQLSYSDQAATPSGNTATFYVKNPDGDISLEVTVPYFIDTTVPTGSIALKDREAWQVLLDKITFGMFFNYAQTMTITAEDTLSGVQTIEYLESSSGLTQEELEAAQWSAYTKPVGVALEDTKNFVYYAKITDKAGNVSFLSTDGAVYDTSAPVISVATGTCYTTRKVTVTDVNLKTVTLNQEETEAPLMLEGDRDAVYTLVATDEAGNETTVTVTMKPIDSLDDSLEGLHTRNVTSAEKAKVQAVLDAVDNVLEENPIVDAEKEKLKAIRDNAAALRKAIEDAAKAINTENIRKVKDKDETNVKLEDKTALETAKAELEAVLTEEKKGNYTAQEQEWIRQEIDRLDKAITVIEETEAVIGAIGGLPDTVKPDLKESVEKAIRDAKAAYDKLTDYQKSLIQKSDRNKLERLYKTLTAYEIIKGSGAKWEKDTDIPLVFTANGPVRKFKELRIDGKPVASSGYTYREGSTVITLKPAYLQKLTTGKHTIQVVYTDGATDGKDTFRIYRYTGNPMTGDNSQMLRFTGVAMTSLLCMAAMILCLPRKKGKYQR